MRDVPNPQSSTRNPQILPAPSWIPVTRVPCPPPVTCACFSLPPPPKYGNSTFQKSYLQVVVDINELHKQIKKYQSPVVPKF